MAEDVGVLQLKIEDNSGKAAAGLRNLDDALLRVKHAVTGGLGLDNVATEVVRLAKTIQDAKGTSTIVKNLGTMFNAINKFANLKNFSIDTEKIRDTAQNMLKLADAKERMDEVTKSSAGVSDWRTGMMGIADDTKEAVTKIEKEVDTFEGQMARAKEIAKGSGDMWGTFMRLGVFSTSPGKKQVPGQTAMDLDGLLKTVQSEVQEKTPEFQEIGKTIGSEVARGIQLSKAEIAESTGFIGDYMKQALYTNTNISDYIRKPIEALPDVYHRVNKAVELYTSGLGAELPKVQQVSSEETMLAVQAKQAAKALEETNKIMQQLEKPIDYSNFQEYTDYMAGLYGGDGNYRSIGQNPGLGFKDLSAIQTFSVPAMDQEGPFQYASDEIARYTSLLRQAQSDVEFFGQKYDEVQKRIKYNGLTSERTNEAAQYEKSFYFAVAKAEEYENHLKQINDYVAEYQNTMNSAGIIKDYFNIPELQSLLRGLEGTEAQMATIQAISSATGIGIEEVTRQLSVLNEEANRADNVLAELNSEATAVASGGMEELQNEIRQITESATPAISKIELLQNKIKFLEERIAARTGNLLLLGLDPENDRIINEYRLQIGRVNEQLDKMVQKAHEAQDAMQFESMKSGADTLQRDYGGEMVDNMVSQYSEIDLLTLKMNGMKQALADDINQNKVDTQQIAERAIAIQNLGSKIDDLKKKQEGATETTKSLKDGLKGLFDSHKQGGLSKLISQFARIAKYRFLRSIIRQITSGISEGIKNLYNYSKEVGTSFAPAMDSASSSLQQMKNSIGAAIAPAIQALIPLLQTVVNWFITGINYINQFFALLNGQKSWTRALPQTVTAFENQATAAGHAAAAMKDLLADWDELNIIQSQTGGGSGSGGGTAAEDYINMFEEVYTFDNKVKEIVTFIQDHFDEILSVAKMIGEALLLWKVAEGIYDVLKLIGTLKGGIIMSVIGFTLSSMAGSALATTGFSAENILLAIGGLAASALGGSWVGAAAAKALGFAGSAGAIMGAIVGVYIGMGLLISSFRASVVKNAYGTLSEDKDTVRRNVMQYFSMGVEASVEVTKARIADTTAAEDEVTKALAVLEQDYPVAVTVKTKESLDQLQTDVQTLISAAQHVIDQRKQNLRISIIASGQTGSDGTVDSAVKFSDDAWAKTEKYMTDIGEEIGRLISDGITDGAELDGLKQDLVDIINAINYGMQSGRFAANMMIAGENLRRNGYTKDTVASYIQTYNAERQSLLDAATEAAVQEQADRKSTLESVRVRYNKGKATKEELDEAQRLYDTFDVNERIQQIFSEWVGEGDSLFSKDISAALAQVMEKAKSEWHRNNITQAAQNVLGLSADDYITALRNNIITAIQKETGQDENELRQLFDTTGLNPLDLFDPTFGNKVREAIAEIITNSDYTMEEKQKIAEAFGFEFNQSANLGYELVYQTKNMNGEMEEQTLRMEGWVARSIEAIRAYQYALNGVDLGSYVDNWEPRSSRPFRAYASGGVVRSGDLVMANENGNFEMMGRMGSQPVVANNQQIVEGISMGVATANGDVVSELRTLATLMTRMLNKEFVAKAVPTADWGRHTQQSAEAYDRVNG